MCAAGDAEGGAGAGVATGATSRVTASVRCTSIAGVTGFSDTDAGVTWAGGLMVASTGLAGVVCGGGSIDAGADAGIDTDGRLDEGGGLG